MWSFLDEERLINMEIELNTLVEIFSPGEVRDHDASKSVDQTKDGDTDECEPPEPEDKEVLLVEQIVGEDAEVVGPVDGSCRRTDPDVAGNLEAKRGECLKEPKESEQILATRVVELRRRYIRSARNNTGLEMKLKK